MKYLILILALLPISISAFDINKEKMGVCGYTTDFDSEAMNYKVESNSILKGIVTTKSLGDYIRLANDIDFDNNAEIIDKDDQMIATTGMLCDMQRALFSYYLDVMKSKGKIPAFPKEITLEDLPTTYLLDHDVKQLKYYLIAKNAKRIHDELYQKLLDGKYVKNYAYIPPKILSKENAAEGLAVVLMLADTSFRAWLRNSKETKKRK